MIARIFSSVFIFLILLYRYFISPLKRPSCRFYPTCSTYSLTLFRVSHPLYALIFSIIRILKCNPWVKGGYDYPLVQIKLWRIEHCKIKCLYWMIPKQAIKLPFCVTKPIQFWAYIIS